MTAKERHDLIRKVEDGLANGLTLTEACRAAGRNKVWYWRWRDSYMAAIESALADKPRSGRPSSRDASLRLAEAIGDLEKKIKTVEGILNAMRESLATVRNTACAATDQDAPGQHRAPAGQAGGGPVERKKTWI